MRAELLSARATAEADADETVAAIASQREAIGLLQAARVPPLQRALAQAQLGDLTERLAECHPADPEPLGELALGGQALAWLDLARQDQGFEVLGHLLEELAAVDLDRLHPGPFMPSCLTAVAPMCDR